MTRDAGFTLVEMIVALGLFALISLAGLGLVDAVLGSERRTAGQLEAIGDVDRAFALLDRDVDGVAGRLVGDAGTLAFGRRGADGVRYTVSAGTLRRVREGHAVVVLDRVVTARWRYLAPGGWRDRWPGSVAEAQGWPRAIELEADTAAIGHVRRIVDLPVRR